MLQAECAARESIRGAHIEAEEQIASARAQARRIHERADARIVRLRAGAQRRLSERIAELHAAGAALQRVDVEPDPCDGRLAVAVARVAAALSGGAR
ncbi:MAG TPA: hypothetical protein PL143_06890 [Rhodocyclaceae bacterium]|nr:hypothetical protein [Rhodocyclaceae bacterium]